MPGLNELLKARGQLLYGRNGGRTSAYQKLKADWERDIFYLVRKARIRLVERASILFVWNEPNRRRDLDNVAAGGRKLILDALVKAKILPDDDSTHVISFRDEFILDAQHPGVLVVLEDRPIAQPEGGAA